MQRTKNGKLKCMYLELTLCEKDKGHLVKFSNCLESNIEIHSKTIHGKDKDYYSCRLNVSCTDMCRDLISLGCFPRKTYEIKFPTNKQVPHVFIRDFIRGYFDGDGCISTSNEGNKDRIELNITGMPDMLIGISDFLISEGVLRRKPKLHPDARSKAYSIFMYGKDSIKDILDYLYKESGIYLDRKYQKYMEFYKDYDEQSPRTGVHYSKRNKAFIATICIEGKKIRIGQFKKVQDANRARIEAEISSVNAR